MDGDQFANPTRRRGTGIGGPRRRQRRYKSFHATSFQSFTHNIRNLSRYHNEGESVPPQMGTI